MTFPWDAGKELHQGETSLEISRIVTFQVIANLYKMTAGA
jgi:hypothetical protein